MSDAGLELLLRQQQRVFDQLRLEGLMRTPQHRHGQQIACPKEVAYRKGFIDRAKLRRHAGRRVERGHVDGMSRSADEATP